MKTKMDETVTLKSIMAIDNLSLSKKTGDSVVHNIEGGFLVEKTYSKKGEIIYREGRIYLYEKNTMIVHYITNKYMVRESETLNVMGTFKKKILETEEGETFKFSTGLFRKLTIDEIEGFIKGKKHYYIPSTVLWSDKENQPNSIVRENISEANI